MREVVGTDQPVLVMQLSYLSEDENGNSRLNVLSINTLANFTLDLTGIEEITYQISN